MHLFKPLELALVARAFDVHGVDYGIHAALAAQVANVVSPSGHLPGTGVNAGAGSCSGVGAGSVPFPGVAIHVLADILSRQLKKGAKEALEALAGRARCIMWEISVQ